MQDIKLLNSLDNVNFGDYNDISFSNADILLIDGVALPRQGVVKILLTTQGSNKLFPGYGSTLQTILQARLDDPSVGAKIKNTIISAISYLVSTQESPIPVEQVSSLKDLQMQFISNPTKGVLVTLVLVLGDGTYLTIPIGS